MRIIGDGFLGRNLDTTFGDRFPEVTAIAAGVSSTSTAHLAEYDREAEVVYDALEECRRAGRRLVFFSTASFSLYGFPDGEATEAGPVRPPSVYGRHKLALESVVRSSGVPYLILRLSHVVGRHQRPHQLLPTLVRAVLDGRVTIHEGAHRDLLDVRHLMHALDRLLRDGVTGEVLNVASGDPRPVEEIVTAIERRLGVTAARDRRPGAPALTRVSVRRLRRLVPDLPPAGREHLGALLDAYLPYYTALNGNSPQNSSQNSPQREQT
ncbi:NAD-dependent epimerase/dehydratase family protein [Streptomyces capitiformicae]|uniref:NAD-dependent epimerase n=1 Tax=Streptomyces capitiformicae TaxID=2014920 RepID=A0A919DQ97_9ACTN|nr:NAD-dependent epimerase/dehydratase family protein [Streptomyces capitiformicae]GHE68757.1 NAD-dependent epimerase [Streptomyces capitiformicae]